MADSTEQTALQRFGTIPALLITGTLLCLIATVTLAPPVWSLFGFGALGWWIALFLRIPVSVAVLGRTGTQQALGSWREQVLVASSGPLEELVRLALVLLLVSGFDQALWAGLGWAMIEVLYTCLSSAITTTTLHRDDDKSRQLREVLAARGLLEDKHGIFAVAERISATLLHVAATLLISVLPILVLLTIPAHSITNLAVTKLTPRSLARAECVFAAIGIVLFCLALLLAL
ncbi:hypothetical protein [Sciscionella sediminilitoris]|uniref:hypothetical protein n=1 Tax=Sciscionella sediminilitoris TaxID=1445613 RepID=UPI00068F31B2|nr:hypothetical protein [Sciscionella sp. SE31]